MSNLSENIKKYFVEKAIDIGSIIVVFMAIYAAFIFINNSWILLAVFLGCLVGLHYLNKKYTDSLLKKWIVPLMQREEEKKYLLVDTVMLLILALVVFLVMATSGNAWVLVILIAAIILFKEIPKWRNFKKKGDA